MARRATTGRGAWGDASDVLALLADRRHWTRAELSRATSLSRSTIAQRLDLLREAGLISEVGRLAPDGGRPTTKIALNDRVHTVAGVELGHSSCRLTVADLGGQPLAQWTVPIASVDDYERILDSIASALRQLLAETSETHGSLAAVTLGVPMSATLGAVGLKRSGHTPGWAGFPAKEWLEVEFAVPVHLENDVNLMALGERLEAYPDVDDLLLVHAGDGIGTGVIAGGSLIRGAHGLAGEIAHVPALRANQELCLCGNVGCLGAVATLPAVLEALTREGVVAHDLADLMRLVSSGDPAAARILRQAGRDVGDILVYSISGTNPQVVVLSGSLPFAGDHFVAGAKESLYRRGAPALTDGLRVVRSKESAGFGTLGALGLAAGHVLTDGSLFALLDQQPNGAPAAGPHRPSSAGSA